MEPSNWKYVGRKLSVHITSLTDEDIDRIRCQLGHKSAKKGNKVSKAKRRKKKSSNSQFFGATASSKNCISESTIDNSFLQNRLPRAAKTRIKREPISSSECSEKQKRAPNLQSSKPAWNDYSSYSSSEESGLEEVFMPEKILVKPLAQFRSRKLSQSDTAPETHIRETPQEIKFNIASKFPILQPIILLKKINLDVKMKPEICDRVSYNSSIFLGNSLDTTVQEKTISSGSDKGDSESEEYADEKPLQHLMIADQVFEDDKPSILKNGVGRSDSSESAATGLAPPRCSCQSTVAPTETIPTAVQINKTKASFQTSPLTSELAEASSQNTIFLKNVTTAERNESDDAFCSPVIFDEESPATRDFQGEVSSPVIFGSNEGTAAESGDAPDRSNQLQDDSTDSCDSSSNFVLELSMDEQSEIESSSKNGVLTGAASQNFDLQLSETVSHQNAQSSVNSPELFSSCSFGLERPSKCTVEDSSDGRNFQPFSRNTNVLSSRAKQISRSSDGEASSNLSRNIAESENNGQFIKDLDFSGNKVPSSALNDETHSKSKTNWLSAVKPSNRFDNQEVFLHSVRSLNCERPKIVFLQKADFDGKKKDSSVVKDLSPSRNQKSPLLPTEASHVMENWKSYLSGLVVSNTSNPKKSCTSVMESPSSSKPKKICLSLSQAANIPTSQSAYLLPVKHSNPSSYQKSNLLSKECTKSPASVPINNRTDAFTQMDFQEVQQPSQLNVNYIINTSSLKTIQFKGPVINHPPAMTAIGKNIPASGSIFAPETHHCLRDFSPNQTKRILCKCSVGHCFHRGEVYQSEKSSTAPAFATKLPACCSDSILDSGKLAVRREGYKESRVLASKMTTDSVSLTGNDEPKREDPSLGRIRLKTPTELGCTIAFTDDVERLFRHELPKLQCNSRQLELLKEKHFNLFKVVLNDHILWKSVSDTLQELYNTRRVPCGSRLMRPSSTRLSSVQIP